MLGREVWARGELAPIVEALDGRRLHRGQRGRHHLGGRVRHAPRAPGAGTWSLDYLRAIALAAGVLGLVGLAMQAVAQQRRRTVAALLLRRMGMSRRAADTVAGLEIGLLAGLAAVVAVAVALPASRAGPAAARPGAVRCRPDPLFAVPWGASPPCWSGCCW